MLHRNSAVIGFCGLRERISQIRPALLPDIPGPTPITQGHVPTAWRILRSPVARPRTLSMTESTRTLVKF